MDDEHIRGLRNWAQVKISTQIRSYLWDRIIDPDLVNQASVKVRCQVLSNTFDHMENLIWNQIMQQIDNQIKTLKE